LFTKESGTCTLNKLRKEKEKIVVYFRDQQLHNYVD